MTKRRKTPEITLRAIVVDGVEYSPGEFDYVKHVMKPYEEKYGTLDGQPMFELLMRTIEKDIKERHARKKRDHISTKGGDNLNGRGSIVNI